MQNKEFQASSVNLTEPSVRTLIPSMPSTDELLPYLKRIDDSRWYSNFGPLNDELVTRFASYFGVSEEHLCLVGNATLGLQAVAELVSIEASTEIEVPSFTFAASAMALISANRRIRFVDIDDEMRCTPSDEARVVMDVLPFGDELRTPSWSKNLEFLIIDAAASFDALEGFANHINISCPFAIVLSLHATKLIGAGEGGLVISSDIDLIRRIKIWQNFGFDISGKSSRSSSFFGTNAKMSEYACAVALASLDRWPRIKSAYSEIQAIATSVAGKHGLPVHSAMQKGLVNPYWIISPNNREITQEISRIATLRGFETRLWWQRGCHEMPAFQNIEKAALEKTSSISDRYIGLPFHLFLPTNYWDSMNLIFEESTK
jgi:dTDP-4-amino-4,6-dideoxygalactose transaminase